MILIFLLLCVIGMFMDATAAIYIFMPILLPTAVSVGISPLFFVVFMVIALSFGLITPPVGVCLYAACNVSGMSIEKITKGLAPWLIVLVLCLLVFILFPEPDHLSHQHSLPRLIEKLCPIQHRRAELFYLVVALQAAGNHGESFSRNLYGIFTKENQF